MGEDRGAATTAAVARAGGRVAGTLGVGATVALASFLRLYHLGARSVWTDEGFTWTVARSPLLEIPARCAREDASPPLFYMFTGLVLRLGDSEFLLRLVSALASLGIVLLTYRIARLFVERWPAILAGLLVALSPFQVMYAQEARSYALVALFATWAFYLFLRAVRFGRRRAWMPYVIVSALGLYTQPIVMLGVVAQAAVVVLDRETRARAARWIGAQVVSVMLYAPWMASSAGQMTHLGDSHWYLTAPTLRDVFHVARTLLVSPIPLVTPPAGSAWPGLEAILPRALAQILLFAIPGVPLVVAALAARRAGPRASLVRIAGLGLVVPLAAVLAASGFKPLWLPRYFVLLGPFVAILIALGLHTLRPRAWASIATALTILLGGYGWLRYDTDYTKEPWRQVVRSIAERSDPEGTVVLVPFDLDPFDYYNGRGTPLLDAFEVGHPDVPFASDYNAQQLEEMDRITQALVEEASTVWVVVRSPNSEVRQEVARRAIAIAGAGHEPVAQERWESVGGPIRVVGFGRGRSE